MKSFQIKQLLADIVVHETSFLSCFCSGEIDENIFPPTWPPTFLAGNLLNFAIWQLYHHCPELRSIAALGNYLPFSYHGLEKDFLLEIEALSTQRLFCPKASAGLGKRSFLPNAVYSFVFQNVLKWSWAELELRLKELLEFKLQGFFSVGQFYDCGLTKEAIPVLHRIMAGFCQEKQVFLQRNPLPFTKQNLSQMGVQFPHGCFYECSGYGLHCFYLPDLQSSFFFLSMEAEMQEVWYIFLRILSELDYFAAIPTDYIAQLEKQILIYPWLEIEVTSH